MLKKCLILATCIMLSLVTCSCEISNKDINNSNQSYDLQTENRPSADSDIERKTISDSIDYDAYTFDYNAGFYQNGFSRVWKLVGGEYKYGFVDEDENITVPCLYDLTGNEIYKDEYIDVKLNDKWGVIDMENNIVVELKYDSVRFEDGLAIVEENEEYHSVELN